MVTHWPSLQVNCPSWQDVIFTLSSFETLLDVQMSLGTPPKSKVCRPIRSDVSSALLTALAELSRLS